MDTTHLHALSFNDRLPCAFQSITRPRQRFQSTALRCCVLIPHYTPISQFTSTTLKKIYYLPVFSGGVSVVELLAGGLALVLLFEKNIYIYM